ncbi:MAG TPA: hypothetical protein EYH04_03725 [Archaeoglobus profundus]|nr:hypothetical protein [Archaeoglobus profundus]
MELQSFIEYKARWYGLNVDYVKPYKTSTLCPIYGCKLNPNGQRLLKCKKCNLIFVATLNLFKSGCGGVPFPPNAP